MSRGAPNRRRQQSRGQTAAHVADHVSASGAAGFFAIRLDGLHDEPRRGTPRRKQVIVRTFEETPRRATRWSSRGMAKASGLPRTTIQQIWRAFGLRPCQREMSKQSNDSFLIEKVRDIVGCA